MYCTENDNFSRIYYYTNPERFEVYSTDGTIIEFKEKVVEPLTNISVSWLISKITDANGNYIEFGYNNYYGGAIPYSFYGLQYYYQSGVLPRYIKYTGNSAANIQSYNEI